MPIYFVTVLGESNGMAKFKAYFLNSFVKLCTLWPLPCLKYVHSIKAFCQNPGGYNVSFNVEIKLDQEESRLLKCLLPF